MLQTGDSPLLTASFNGHLKCVELLLESGASVDVQNEVSVTIAVHMCERLLAVELPPGHVLVLIVVLVHWWSLVDLSQSCRVCRDQL